MGFMDALSSRMMPQGMSPREIFAPQGTGSGNGNGGGLSGANGGAVKWRELLATYDGPGKEKVLSHLEQRGIIGAGSTDAARAGVRGARLTATGGMGGVGAAGAGAASANPIYASPFARSMRYGNELPIPAATSLGTGSLIDDVAPLADDVAGLADDVAGVADNVAGAATASPAEQAMVAHFEQLSKVPLQDRPALLADALDLRAAAKGTPDSIETLTRALIDGPIEDSSPAMREALGRYTAKLASTAEQAAPKVAKAARASAPAAAKVAAKVAAEAAPAATAAISHALSPTMAALVHRMGPIDASALRGISAFARPLETPSCLEGIGRLLVRVHR